MTDHNREEREALIEKTTNLIRSVYGDQVEDIDAISRTIANLFDQAHTPTSDEREALARVVAKADEETLDYERRLPDYCAEPWEGYMLHADHILAAGFRRTAQGGPSWERIYEVAREAQDRGIDAAWIADRLTPDPRTVQGEPTDALVRAVWDALGPGITITFEYEELRAALSAAFKAGGHDY